MPELRRQLLSRSRSGEHQRLFAPPAGKSLPRPLQTLPANSSIPRLSPSIPENSKPSKAISINSSPMED
jgi:hypothetical protein